MRNSLRETIANIRKARYQNGASNKPTFVSGDVAAGQVRTVSANDEPAQPERREGDD